MNKPHWCRYFRSWCYSFRWQRRLIAALVLFGITMVAVDAWARAGGGGSFRSGSSGGGGGGDGDGIGLLIFYLLRFAIVYPELGVPLLIVVVVVVVLSYRGGQNVHVTRSICRYNRRQSSGRMEMQLARIASRDPQFQLEKFRQRGEKVFLRLQDAWAKQDMRSVRTMVSDGIFERFSLQLQMMHESRLINRMNNVRVRDIAPAQTDSDRFFDAITLRITAEATDYYEDRQSGKVVNGCNGAPQSFVEYWTFLRRPGAKTVAGKSLLDNCCPNCGAPLEISDRTVCPSCRAVVNSGDYDWVLTEITQASEWMPKEKPDLSGLNKLLSRDPSFNVNHLEDRVSVMFYRWIAAQFFADPRYLCKLAGDKFMQQEAAKFQPQPDGKHLFYADAAVGGVEVTAVGADADGDVAQVRVRWSGHREAATVPGLILPACERSRVFASVYELHRQRGVSSSAGNVLSSAHCPNCGAPESLSLHPYCEYCHTPLNDGSRDWVLTAIRPFGSCRSDNIMAAETTTADRLEADDFQSGIVHYPDLDQLLALAAAAMLADGEIAPKEYQLLQSYAAARHYDENRLQRLIASVKEHTLTIALPEEREQREFLLLCLIRMCLADGKVTGSERNFLQQIATKMGLSDYDLTLRIKRERLALYRQARKSRS
ncbi:MAG: TIM44-like domain-containing protein [Victivallales bacterium]|nr:TIM44-like domain-containing protein [Victivallales bacterium]